MGKKEYKGSFATLNENLDKQEKTKSGFFVEQKVEKLVKKVENLELYSNYVAENVDKGIKYTEHVAEKVNEIIDNPPEKDDIFVIFYINVDGLTRQQVENNLIELMKTYKMDNVKSYNVEIIFMPVKNQETKVEIINPKLINGDIVKAFKNLVDTLDDDKYKEIIENL